MTLADGARPCGCLRRRRAHLCAALAGHPLARSVSHLFDSPRPRKATGQPASAPVLLLPELLIKPRRSVAIVEIEVTYPHDLDDPPLA